MAISRYDKALQYLCVVVPEFDDDARMMEELVISLNLNLATCWLKLCAYEVGQIVVDTDSVVASTSPVEAKPFDSSNLCSRYQPSCSSQLNSHDEEVREWHCGSRTECKAKKVIQLGDWVKVEKRGIITNEGAVNLDSVSHYWSNGGFNLVAVAVLLWASRSGRVVVELDLCAMTGIIAMELFGEPDVETSSETSSDDQDDIFSIYGGHAQSILSSLEDSIGKIDDFLSFERGFLRGDIVCSAENSSGQMGRIFDVEMFVDLENVFGKIIKDSYGWLHGISRKKQNEGTVFSVAVGLVHVDWISSAMVGFSTSLPPPTSWQDPKNLTILSCFPNANWQLGDWVVLPSIDGNCETSGTCCSKFDDIFSIVKKKIKVDVMWQDGSCSTGLDSHSLFPVSVVNAHDFFPGQFVLEKTGSDDLNIHANRRWGFVRSVDAIERTVKVKWRSTDGDGKDMDVGVMEEIVSAYELLEHPDFCFNISDIVLRSDISHLNDFSGKEDCLDGFSGKEDCNTDFSGIHGGCFLSCIGNVIGLDGDVEVQWASGATTKVAPYEILRIEKDDGSVAAPVFHEEHVSELNYEVEHSVHNEDLPESLVGDAVNRQTVQRNSRFFGLSQVAMGFLSRIAANFFGSHDSSSLPQSTSRAHVIKDGKSGSFDGQEVLESCDTFSAMPNMAISDFDAYGSISLKQELKQSSENTGLLLAENKGSSLFRQFDVVRDCSDHHFLDGVGKGVALSQASSYFPRS
ncbi:hypothetical protein Cgig2_033001 [Carnegiea gigantea]|uniref:Uncharacterized protein n=1 Tax=Carnegiea gigantea TaxID=171969 RepID=A0A9Q1JUM9_9CARY|nr:hypothetical protein Cgig2_033001 [Carnegiea gigantea]